VKLKVELSDEIAKLKKSSSVWISFAFTVLFSIPDAIDYAWHHIPDDLKGAIPGHWATGLAAVAFGLTFAARILRFKFTRNGDQNAQASGVSQ
jgi:hypothetical protein